MKFEDIKHKLKKGYWYVVTEDFSEDGDLYNWCFKFKGIKNNYEKNGPAILSYVKKQFELENKFEDEDYADSFVIYINKIENIRIATLKEVHKKFPKEIIKPFPNNEKNI